MGLEDWLNRCSEFLRAAYELRDAGLFSLACFSAHQAVEMCLKGVLIWRTGSHPFTHSLTELLDVISKLGFEVPEGAYKEAEWLEPHYILARYPARGVKPYTSNTASRCIAAAELITSLVEKWCGKSLPRG
ncbi:MAG: HEPN domain-containing protein [Thermoproteus sp.]